MMHAAEFWLLSSAQRGILQPEPHAIASALYNPSNVSGIRCSLAYGCYQTVFFCQRGDRSNELPRFARLNHNIKLKHGRTWRA